MSNSMVSVNLKLKSKPLSWWPAVLAVRSRYYRIRPPWCFVDTQGRPPETGFYAWRPPRAGHHKSMAKFACS